MKTLLSALILASVTLAGDCPSQQQRSAPAPRQRVTVRETVYEPAQEAPRLLVREVPVYREVPVIREAPPVLLLQRAAPPAPLYLVPAAPRTTVYYGPLGRARKVVVD